MARQRIDNASRITHHVSRFANHTTLLLALASILAAAWAGAAERRVLPDHLPPGLARLQPLDRLPGNTNLYLVIGLPLRNTNALATLLQQLYDPASTNFHQYLTSEQFAERFGPTKEDYQKVVAYAGAHNLKVTATHPNRLLVDVAASVADVERTFDVTLRTYRHPTESRDFFAADTEPSVEAGMSILNVSGLDNYALPRPMNLKVRPSSPGFNPSVTPYSLSGTGPGGTYTGKDFRAAYASGVTNTGSGQFIAIVDVGGPYYTNDIYMYQTNAGFSTSIVITNILLSGWTGIPTGTNDDDGEEVLDIDMAMSLAPGATILNYEGEAHDVFNQIAVDNKAKQMTLSYGFGIDETIRQIFLEFVAQGQSFFQASGDGGADLSGGGGLTGEPYATIVGGTALSTSGAGGPWQSETTWVGSGGGVSSYGIPAWQEGINMQTNQGSTTYRNYPDVALLADTAIFIYFKNGQPLQGIGGTSASSPQWAGFMALVNQAAASQGKPSIGFANPSIYALGRGSYFAYTNAFHDITTGNTFNNHNPLLYYATNGYDLCTGWGSPRGSNTITALIGVGTNDFTLNASQVSLYTVRGSVATTIIRVVPMNGFSGSANLSISGLSGGVTALFSPATVNNSTTLLTLTAAATALPGSNNVTVTAVSGGLTHTMTLSLTLAAPIPGAASVSLTSYYNRVGIYSEGRTFSGGLDTVGYAYSANLLGPAPAWKGVAFALGPINAADVIVSAGQSIPLPSGQATTLLMLATAVNGSQNNQTFIVTYTDNSTTTFSQGISDWASPQSYAGESTFVTMTYRNNGGGTKDMNTTVSVFGYSLTLNQTKAVKSITLPNNGKVLVLAMALANEPASVSLASFYNRAGMYTDGTTFTNPATGGIDGGGAAYSATLLGSALTWNGVQFNFGPANVTNVISGANQTITLPPGNYSVLRMLATGLQGNQASQTFTVTYANSTTSTFIQSLSDWFTPQNYTGEAKAVPMGHRNSSNGTTDNRTFYLYGYSFNLTSSKIVQSIRLPNNGNVAVLAISLIPDWPPSFTVNPFTLPGINAGLSYSGTIATNATDLNGDTITFAKTSGPAWLTVAANGTLSGTPANSDAGTNTFVVRATDPGGLSGTATMYLYVNGAPSFINDPFAEPDGSVGQLYSGTVATNATDPNGDSLIFAKVSGPVWLSVASDGSLSGIPASGDVGTGTSVVSATDSGGLSATATMSITVSPTPPLTCAIIFQGSSLLLSWSGGNPPYQVQMATNLATPDWQLVGTLTSTTNLLVSPTNTAAFYRIFGQ
jgi:hypothetical protein